MRLDRLLAKEALGVSSMSYAGVLLRILLGYHITNVRNAEIADMALLAAYSYLLPNIVGCFIMGLFLANSDLIKETCGAASYKALTVGLCGCLTTFSSWMELFAVDLSNQNNYITIVAFLIQFAICFSCLEFGLLVSDIINYIIIECYYFINLYYNYDSVSKTNQDNELIELPELEDTDKSNTDINIRQVQPDTNDKDGDNRNAVDSCNDIYCDTELVVWGLLFAVSFILVWALVAADSGRSSAIFYGKSSNIYSVSLRSIALAPFGALVRWLLSQASTLTKTLPALHLHTLLANMVGVTVLMVMSVGVINSSKYSGSDEGIMWATAISTGFAGSVSTVSSFLSELRALHSRQPSTHNSSNIENSDREGCHERPDTLISPYEFPNDNENHCSPPQVVKSSKNGSKHRQSSVNSLLCCGYTVATVGMAVIIVQIIFSAKEA